MPNDILSAGTEPVGVIEHLMPGNAALDNVELSIVVPALNEEITVGEFIDWCKEGLERAGVSGQILIVDSSTDDTARIVLEHGGEVLRTPKRGLGRAYIDAIPYIRGKWIVMGDADLTYDFRELTPFVEEFRKGAEFVMGSRFRGSIEKGAMPGLHRYFGTPLTTWILNRIYGSNYSDIHCGMRGLTRAALEKIDLKSQSWEYASEMVLKAARLGLVTAEVPVKFYKDREGTGQSPSADGLAVALDSRLAELEGDAGLHSGFIFAQARHGPYGDRIVAFAWPDGRPLSDWKHWFWPVLDALWRDLHDPWL